MILLVNRLHLYLGLVKSPTQIHFSLDKLLS